MNSIRQAFAQAGLPKAQALPVLVFIEEYNGGPGVKLIREYVFDYNDEQQRRVFAAQCRHAIEAGQSVSTMRADV